MATIIREPDLSGFMRHFDYMVLQPIALLAEMLSSSTENIEELLCNTCFATGSTKEVRILAANSLQAVEKCENFFLEMQEKIDGAMSCFTGKEITHNRKKERYVDESYLQKLKSEWKLDDYESEGIKKASELKCILKEIIETNKKGNSLWSERTDIFKDKIYDTAEEFVHEITDGLLAALPHCAEVCNKLLEYDKSVSGNTQG